MRHFLFISMLLHKGKYKSRVIKADNVSNALKEFKSIVTEEINIKANKAYQRDCVSWEKQVKNYEKYQEELKKYKENNELGKPKRVKKPCDEPILSDILEDTRNICREYPHRVRIIWRHIC